MVGEIMSIAFPRVLFMWIRVITVPIVVLSFIMIWAFMMSVETFIEEV